jgi:pre-mRNA-splicing factor ATP-dependent RNA helicase DHX15/PRP43
VDAPAPETLMRALELLNYLAAIDDDGILTPLGGMMSEFPLDPQVSWSVVWIYRERYKDSSLMNFLVDETSHRKPKIRMQPRNTHHSCNDVRSVFVCKPIFVFIDLFFSVPNIWLRPYSATTWLQEEADAAKARLTIPDSDHLTLLNVYNQYDCSACSHNFFHSISYHLTHVRSVR